jgi:hypothetical protein
MQILMTDGKENLQTSSSTRQPLIPTQSRRREDHSALTLFEKLERKVLKFGKNMDKQVKKLIKEKRD